MTDYKITVASDLEKTAANGASTSPDDHASGSTTTGYVVAGRDRAVFDSVHGTETVPHNGGQVDAYEEYQKTTGTDVNRRGRKDTGIADRRTSRRQLEILEPLLATLKSHSLVSPLERFLPPPILKEVDDRIADILAIEGLSTR